jgi:hypothetical protein
MFSCMANGFRRFRLLPAAAIGLALAVAVPAQAATTIGSSLSGSVQASVCPFTTAMQTEASCTVAQGAPNPSYTASGGVVAPISGVIVRWRIVTGTASGALSIKARLQTLRANTGGGGEGSFTSIPLAEPGLHVFPTQLPIAAGERLALDTVITKEAAGTAALPIVAYGTDAGFPQEWKPELLEGETRAPFQFPTSSYNVMLNADIEPDADHDGYGDETQDQCPSSAAIQATCLPPPSRDVTAPRTKLTYPPRQDFLGAKKVRVNLRSNEAATAIASGQLEIGRGDPKKTGRIIYGLYGVKRKLTAGNKKALVLRLPRNTRKAAAAAIANGKKVVVKVTVTATDTAGNRSGATVAVIRPKL